MIRSTLRIFIATSFAGMILWGLMRYAQAGDECNDATLQGRYGYSYDGYALDDTAETRNLALGTFIADQKGGLSGAETASVGGRVVHRTWTGAYQVNADCTGSAALTFADGGEVHLDLVIDSESRSLRFIITDPGVIITGLARPTGERCTAASLQGVYDYAFDNAALFESGQVQRTGAIGWHRMDGAGNLAGAGTASFNGITIRRTWIGTYQVNANCTGTIIRQDDLGGIALLDLVVLDEGREFRVINTLPTTAQLGIHKKRP